MTQPYLFYSERSAPSMQIIETLKGLNKTSLYKFVAVETIKDKINQLPFQLTKIPTLYVPDTKEVVVGQDIYGYIAKPTNSRKELPTKGPGGGGAPTTGGEYSPWGFEGGGTIGESYSLWDAPGQFANQGGSMYTFLDGQSVGGGSGPGAAGPKTENTIAKNKTAANDDIASRMEAMNNQRKSEFAGIERK